MGDFTVPKNKDGSRQQSTGGPLVVVRAGGPRHVVLQGSVLAQ